MEEHIVIRYTVDMTKQRFPGQGTAEPGQEICAGAEDKSRGARQWYERQEITV